MYTAMLDTPDLATHTKHTRHREERKTTAVIAINGDRVYDFGLQKYQNLFCTLL